EGQGDRALPEPGRRGHHLPRLRRHRERPLRGGHRAGLLRHRGGRRPGQARPRRPDPDEHGQARRQRRLRHHRRCRERQLQGRGAGVRPGGRRHQPRPVRPLRRRRAPGGKGRRGPVPPGHHQRRRQGPRCPAV
ncbi:MAG: Nucleoside ABC transporter, periplasmic nucleoside-binding protein, partial [uncultured Rubrobacteraceae bacterium]